jgi:pyruvate dehydrogenase (quinone)
LTIPQDVFDAKADGGVRSVATLKPRAEIIPNEQDVIEITRRIDAARSIVIMCGAGCQGSGDDLRQLSDRLKAPLIHSVKGQDIMAYDDPHWMGGIGMIGNKAVYDAVMDCDLFLMLGTTTRIPSFCRTRERSFKWTTGRACSGAAPHCAWDRKDRFDQLWLLLERVNGESDAALWNRVTNERRKWDGVLDRQADPARSVDRIHPQAVARAVSDMAKRDAVFVLDTGLNTLWSANWIRQSGSQRIIGSFNNAAVGTALGQANGIQALDRARQVIALCGDGGFNMLMCEFMTSVHHGLPVKVIVYNNSSFGLIPLEAEAAGLPLPGFSSQSRTFRTGACMRWSYFFAPLSRACCTPKSEALAEPGQRSLIACRGRGYNFPHLEFSQITKLRHGGIRDALPLRGDSGQRFDVTLNNIAAKEAIMIRKEKPLAWDQSRLGTYRRETT